MKEITVTTPFTLAQATTLQSGDKVLLCGTVYTARDAAHQRLVQCLEAGQPLPFPLQDAIIYYAGPSPTPPGRVVGAIGPTTSGRMDAYTPQLLAAGLRGMIGKGQRSDAVRTAIAAHQAVYFAALGGAAALLARCVEQVEMIAWPELGAEAVRKLVVKNLPLTVINDCYGQDLYTTVTVK